MQQEVKYGGFTATPDNYNCPDGDIAAMANLVPEDGALHPVLPPTKLFTVPTGKKILALHDTAAYTHYILMGSSTSGTTVTNTLHWVDADNPQVDSTTDLPTVTDISHNFTDIDIIKVEPVGNTLVVLASDGLHYILWKVDGNKYVYLGQTMPRIDISFGLDSKLVAYPGWGKSGKPKPGITIKSGAIGTIEYAGTQYKQTPTFDNPNDQTVHNVPPKPYILEHYSSSYNESWDGFDFQFNENQADDESGVGEAIKNMSDYAIGAINGLIATEGNDKGRFIFPFFVRYAYELYDGTTVMHSYPVLMIPNSRGPIFGLNSATDSNAGLVLYLNSDTGETHIDMKGRAYAFSSKLCYEASIASDIDNWKDIIHRINVYVSEPIYTFNQDGKVLGWRNMDDDGAWDSFYTIGKISETNAPSVDSSLWNKWKMEDVFLYDTQNTVGGQTYKLYHPFNQDPPSYILYTPEPSKKELENRILNAGIFYMIHHFDIDELKTKLSGDIDIERESLGSLRTKTTLTDDYYTRDKLIANTSFAYNSRINLGGISREQHNPLNAHIQWTKFDIGSNNKWNIAVKIPNDERENVLASGLGQNDTGYPLFVFYPDPKVNDFIVETEENRWHLKPTDHPLLWGSYWLGDLWDGESLDSNEIETEIIDEGGNTTNDALPVKLPNKAYTSEVNNPFYFPVTGVNTIGHGKILGLCSAVKPVSTGQFGYADLYIFADSGLWVAKINEKGTYNNIDLVSGDICINEDSITQMESTVLFTTSRGIMLVSGSTTQCISDDVDSLDKFTLAGLYDGEGFASGLATLAGADAVAPLTMATFKEFMNGSRIVYDYIHQRIIIYNDTKTNGALSYPYAYIYSLGSHKWGVMSSNLVDHINSYPEALAVTATNKLVDLCKDDASAEVPFTLVTRPLKLGGADILKTVNTVIQRGEFQRGDVKTILFGSRDLKRWLPIYDSVDHYLRGFRGTAYKYFTILSFGTLGATDTLTGATVQLEAELTNQPR